MGEKYITNHNLH